MRFFYSFIVYLLTPFLLIRLWWKGRSSPAYRVRISERFSLNKVQNKAVDVWLHAVSLGEVIAAIPLIDAMLSNHWAVLVTTMTPTGSERVQTHFGSKVMHQYIPYDLPIALKRFFKRTQPRVGVIMETELWPNLIHQASVMQIPLLLANGRISDDSFKGYQWIKFILKPLLNQFSAILTQGTEDAKRYIALGASEKLVHFSGNMKFDLQTNNIDSKKFQDIKACWGEARVVVIAASTHDHEESQLLTHLKRLQQAIPGVIVLIAPRHPERFQTVHQLSLQAGFNTGLRSNLDTLNSANEVVVLDSLGELLGWYQMSDYAFVGGSLVPIGGHNVLEPIAMHVPVLSGKEIHNFKAICQDLQEAKGIILVQEAQEVIEGVIRLHQDPILREQLIKNASFVFEKNKGAVQRHLQKIEEIMQGERFKT